MTRKASNTLVVRADANGRIGTGHLMRCLALGQAWQAQKGSVIFVTDCESGLLRKRLVDEGCQVVTVAQAYPHADDWNTLSKVLETHPGAWVVLDGYHFDAVYQKKIQSTAHRLLVIDDMAHLPRYHANIILNQNIHARQLHYNCNVNTSLLLGTEYVLLRREFWSWQSWQRQIPEIARKVLVTMGGADPDNLSLLILQALGQGVIDKLDVSVTVVVGASNPHLSTLESMAENLGKHICIQKNVHDMPALIAWADAAISASGSTLWEFAFMGLPSLILILAPNQLAAAREVTRRGVAQLLGEANEIKSQDIAKAARQFLPDRNLRNGMSQKGRELVDGNGCFRVIAFMGDHQPGGA